MEKSSWTTEPGKGILGSSWLAVIPKQCSWISVGTAQDATASWVLPRDCKSLLPHSQGFHLLLPQPSSQKVWDAGACNPTCHHSCWPSAEATQTSFFPPKSTRGIPPPCLAALAGNPVDFELFSGSIKQGLQTGIKGISLCCALWESCSCSLCSLSSLVCAPQHTWMKPRMGNLLHGNPLPFPFPPPPHLLRK